jgi:F0F1-type ATP synthase alpha subunit
MSFLKHLEKFSIGRIQSIQDNVIIASGLENVFIGEVVKFKSQASSLLGQVLNLEKNQVRIVLLNGKQSDLTTRDLVYRTYRDVSWIWNFRSSCFSFRILL